MNFVDEARIYVQAGQGGKGCESFYKDNYIRHPRPDGGDGGKGGNILVRADRNIHTLLDFKFKQHYKAKSGGHASSKGKTGRDGESRVLGVPLGTMVYDAETDLLMKDLVDDGQTVIVARGGRGGIGNAKKKTPQPPRPGEERTIRFELKLIADAGLIGFPNAGKSTLISVISRVKSKAAGYPFTTKQPILGFVPGEEFDFIIADLPGLIEGAHEGKGLGDRFLRHAERTKILVHVLDMAGTEGRDPLQDYKTLLHELRSHKTGMVEKRRILVANKMDMPQSGENLRRLRKQFPDQECLPVSALTREGVDTLVYRIRSLLREAEDSENS